MRPHRIQVSSSRWDRLEEAEELDTSEEPLLRRDPLMDRMDLESASSSLHPERGGEDQELRLRPEKPPGLLKWNYFSVLFSF